MRMIFLHTLTFLGILCGVSAKSLPYRNVALRGRATQSTILNDYRWGFQSDAINAVDGNQDPNAHHGSCSHTDKQLSPWWRVDLLKPYKIAYIKVTNRYHFSYRLNGAEILIGDSLSDNGNHNPRCAVITSIPDGATQTFYCHGMTGRYVNIIIRGKYEFLQLCEVQIWTATSD
ncbi:fucolectin-like isoform X1 [Rana temporaria]|uniref:fucolectin-like isoform X1 n=1 Tax=Rana temporaria TaxID=8407 RepID=UPI001AADB46C|nr:fucolectin-like isoform X1 [Rana temporaria]